MQAKSGNPLKFVGGEEGGHASTGTQGQRSPVKHCPHIVTYVIDILHV